jgi:hypothetical protein
MEQRKTSHRSGHFSRLSARAAFAGVALSMLAWPLAASGQTNVAPGGIAAQSSDLVFEGAPAEAGRAIDGDVNGWFFDGSVSSTAGGTDSAPWWQVDLGADHQIDEIVIWNRTDCCMERLYLFTVEIESEAGDVVRLQKVFNAPAERDFHPPMPPGGAVGRFVRIVMEFDPANASGRYLTLAEVQVFGELAPEPPSGELPVDRNLPLAGSWTQKMKTTWDGPRKAVDRALSVLRRNGFDFDEIPYQCSWQLGSDREGSIRFVSGESDRFELRDAYGNLVTGTYERKGADGEKFKLKADTASEKALKKILDRSASNCAQIDDYEEDGDEEFLGLKVKLEKYVLRGKIEDGERFVLKGKLKGKVKWKRWSKKLGKFHGSGTTIHKIRYETSLVELPPPLPVACLADQGPHIYPYDGAQLQGWVELTEIVGSDNFYLILSDDFVSILRDFEEDSQTIRTILAAVDADGVPCNTGGRSVVSVELTEFAKDNVLYVVEKLEDLESALTAAAEAFKRELLEPAYEWLAGELVGIAQDILQKFVELAIKAFITILL